MLELKDLCVAYRGAAPTLSHLTLRLSTGVTAVIGRNGVGKSTLLRAILGELPYTGSLLLQGEEVASIPQRQRARLVSLLPQHLPSPTLTVEQTVALGFSPHVTRLGEKERQTVREILDRLCLCSMAQRAVSTLSGGERQRVFWGLMLAQDTPVLLLDEPATYMDAPLRTLLYEQISALRARGKTVLLVLHDLNDALCIADRILLLENGGIAFDGSPDACISQGIPETRFTLKHFVATDANGLPVHFYK